MMERIAFSSYDVLIERGLLKKAGDYVRKINSSFKAIIISDETVWSLCGEKVKSSLEKNGFEVAYHTFPSGEKFKTLDTVKNMLSAMSEAGLTRENIVVALGGGVVGDLAGFASAIYLRGIDYVNIPTTLTSLVDSSVGGKTGCDSDFGKNLIGAFYNPKLVIADCDTIKTLPECYIKDGMGEVIKCAAIKSETLFEKLENANSVEDILDEIVYECIDIKRQIVEKDFRESEERMLLNFGHTLGHAIEKLSSYKIYHGNAVSVGILKITGASEKMGYTEKGTAERIKNLLLKFELPTETNYSSEQLIDAVLYDKKRRDDFLNLVLIKSIGNPFIRQFKTKDLKNIF